MALLQWTLIVLIGCPLMLLFLYGGAKMITAGILHARRDFNNRVGKG